MNYIKELNAFQQWLLFNNLPTGAICLWRTLLSINNTCGWKKQFNAPNSTVYQLTGLNEDGHELARQQLVKKGLIIYKPGVKGVAPVYEIVSFCPDQPLIPGQSSPLLQEEKSGIPKQKQERGGGTANPFIMYEENFGVLKPVLRDSLIAWCDDLGDEIVMAGIKLAIEKGGRTFNYLEAILKEWAHAGLKTIEQVRNYENHKEKGKNNALPFRKQKLNIKEWCEELREERAE